MHDFIRDVVCCPEMRKNEVDVENTIFLLYSSRLYDFIVTSLNYSGNFGKKVAERQKTTNSKPNYIFDRKLAFQNGLLLISPSY